MLYVGEGLRGSNGAHSTLHRISNFHSATQNQIGPLWCWFPSGWACAHSRLLRVSPRNSPVKLGVSPTAASTPTGVFNQRFEALFPCAGALGCVVCFTPRHSSRFICVQMWDCRVSHPPFFQESSPPLLPVWMNVSSLTPWLSDFHTV